MAISVLCPCGKKLKAPDSAAGRVAKCPACGAMLDVPTMDEIELEEEIPFPAINLDPPRPVAAATPPPFVPPPFVPHAVPPGAPPWVLPPPPITPWYYGVLAFLALCMIPLGLLGVFGNRANSEMSATRLLAGIIDSLSGFLCIACVILPPLIFVLIDIGTSLRRIINRLPAPIETPDLTAKK